MVSWFCRNSGNTVAAAASHIGLRSSAAIIGKAPRNVRTIAS